MMAERIARPPVTTTADGSERRVGVEIELADLGLEDVAALVARVTDGSLRRVTPYEWSVEDTAWGTFRIEIDSHFLKRIGREGARDVWDRVGRYVADVFVGNVTPVEVCGPPIPISRLGIMDEIGLELARSGGADTSASLFYAFGIHFNPDVTSTEAKSMVRHLQSFILLAKWIASDIGVDPSRRMTPFIDPYPRDYQRLVLDPAYAPSISGLIDDYLRHNATRNRALDMLPLFTWLDEERVRAGLRDMTGVKARPTWHYRLPDSRLAHGGRVLDGWRSWVIVERLAEDSDALARLAAQWRDMTGLRGFLAHESWAAHVDDFLTALGFHGSAPEGRSPES